MIDDKRVQAYRNLKTETRVESPEFIAEGPETLRLLLANADIAIHSLFLKPATFDKLIPDIVLGLARRAQQPHDDDGAAARPPAPAFAVYVAPHQLMAAVIGMDTCRGSLAHGTVPSRSPDALLSPAQPASDPFRILAIDDSFDDANVGSMVRTASCLGVHAVLISERCVDAFTRRAIRTSMGHCFWIPVIRCDLPATIRMLRERHGVEPFAAVIDNDARNLDDIPRGGVQKR